MKKKKKKKNLASKRWFSKYSPQRIYGNSLQDTVSEFFFIRFFCHGLPCFLPAVTAVFCRSALIVCTEQCEDTLPVLLHMYVFRASPAAPLPPRLQLLFRNHSALPGKAVNPTPKSQHGGQRYKFTTLGQQNALTCSLNVYIIMSQ
jgi:hypothetical protein